MPRPKSSKADKAAKREAKPAPEPEPAPAPEPKPDGWRRYDLIARGSARPSPAGTATFVGLRLLDLPLQYHLLRSGVAEQLVARLGLLPSSSLAGAAVGTARTGVALLDRLGLSSTQLLLLAAATGAAAKQLLWLAYLNGQEFPPRAAALVAAYNTALNVGNALLFAAAATSSAAGSPGLRVSLFSGDVPLAAVVGAGAVAVGLAVETVAEYQRKAFKADARHRSRLCTVGLWRYVRHANYLGYALWRGGYCMIATGWVGGLLFGLVQGWDLGTRAAGVLDEYCSEKYGQQWARYKQEVPYRLVPGLY